MTAASLFSSKTTLNADISKWNVASVASMLLQVGSLRLCQPERQFPFRWSQTRRSLRLDRPHSAAANSGETEFFELHFPPGPGAGMPKLALSSESPQWPRSPGPGTAGLQLETLS